MIIGKGFATFSGEATSMDLRVKTILSQIFNWPFETIALPSINLSLQTARS